MPKRFGFAVVVALLGLLVFFLPVHAITYQWTDEQGNLHFTDDLTNVPPPQREKARIVPLPERTRTPSPVKTTPAPPTDPLPVEEEPPFSMEPDRSPPLDAAAQCKEELRGEKDRLKKQLASDQVRLEELNKLIHRTVRSRLVNRYRRERVQVKERILQARKVMEEEWPQREWECQRKGGL